MAIAPVSSPASNVPPPVDPLRQAFGQLTNALQSGDLSAAQSAYASLSQAAGGDPNSPFAQALSQCDALQSGDIGKAQAALTTLQQQMQAMKGAHHHHGHHHASGSDPSQSTSTPASTSSDPTASTSPVNQVDVTA